MKRHRGHPRSKLAGYAEYQVSPFASTQMEGPRRAWALFSTCFDLIRTGFRPDRAEPLAWYDRAIRIVGGFLILVGFGAGLILLAIQTFKK